MSAPRDAPPGDGRPASRASNRGSPVRTPMTRDGPERRPGAGRRRPGVPPGRARPGCARPRPGPPGGGWAWPPPRSASRRGRGRSPPTSWGAARPPRPGAGPRGPAGRRPRTRPARRAWPRSSTTSPSMTAGRRAGSRRRQQPVERGHVPGPARLPVGGGVGLVEGGAQPHRTTGRHRRSPRVVDRSRRHPAHPPTALPHRSVVASPGSPGATGHHSRTRRERWAGGPGTTDRWHAAPGRHGAGPTVHSPRWARAGEREPMTDAPSSADHRGRRTVWRAGSPAG